MALSLRDVRCDPIANRAINELMHHYTVAQEKGRLVLTKKTGDMKLFLNDLDDHSSMGFHAQSADGEGDRTVACAIDHDKSATGELEGPCLDGRDPVARSHCQNQQQWWPSECQ